VATRARPHTRAAAAAIVKGTPGAVLSGIVPDSAHLDDGGYHVSIADLRRYGNAGDYSNTRTLDKAPPVTTAGRENACAIDVSMPKASMIRTYKNVERVFNARKTDTRAKYINAINVWSGQAGVAPVRFNFQTGSRGRANRSHEWHGHGDWPRVFVDDGYNAASAERAARAMVSVWLGQSHDAWLRQEKLGPYAPKPPAPPVKPKPPVTPAPAPAPAQEDDHMIDSYTLPARIAYRTPDTAGIVDAEAILTLPLPPVGHPQHSWGKAYGKPYISLAGDHMTAPQRVRVAINDGAKWLVRVYEVKAGARFNVEVPPPANLTAYNVLIGRVAPDGLAADAPLPEPEGVIGVLVEMIKK
jgi:hypothetical protein